MASNISALRPHHLLEAINDNGGGADGESVTLGDAYAAMVAIRDELYPYRCPKCGTQGEYPQSKETGNPEDVQKVTCDLCLGRGGTMVQKVAVVATYKDA